MRRTPIVIWATAALSVLVLSGTFLAGAQPSSSGRGDRYPTLASDVTVVGLTGACAGADDVQACLESLDVIAHTQGTDLGLDTGGTNPITAATLVTMEGSGAQAVGIADAPTLAVTNMTGSAAGLDSDATAHASSNGGSHTYLDQAVTIAGVPTFAALDVDLPADDNITIDGASNPRTLGLGALLIDQVPAVAGTRAIELMVNSTGYNDTMGMVIDYTADGLSGTAVGMGVEVSVDTGTSTGGEVNGFRVARVGTGSASVSALDVLAGVDPIIQRAGASAAVEIAFTYDGGFTDVTAAFNSDASDVQLFVSNGDKVYIGNAVPFSEIDVILAVVASGAGVRPVFAWSDGAAGFTTFDANDGTNGYRNNGEHDWSSTALVGLGWAQDTVNGQAGKYWIEITRTQGGAGTPPTEDTIQVDVTVDYGWDKSGDLTVNDIAPGGTVDGRDIAADGTELDKMVPYDDLTDGYAPRRNGAAWGDTATCYADDITELLACLSGASAGDLVYAAAGTYTTTNALGVFTVPSGVTFQGAGRGQTILTQDGSLADDIVKMDGVATGTYGIGAAGQWATTGTTGTAADAGNVVAGDVLHFDDPASGERMDTYATANGNPGTGAIAWQHPLPVALGATTTVAVYGTYTQNVTLRDFTVQAEATATDSAIRLLASRDLIIEDVELLGPNSANTEPALQPVFVVGGSIHATIADWDYRSSAAMTEVSMDLQCRGGSGSSASLFHNMNRVSYSWITINDSGGTTTDDVVFTRGHRNQISITSSDNVTNALELNSSDDNVYHLTARGAPSDSGVGNVGDST